MSHQEDVEARRGRGPRSKVPIGIAAGVAGVLVMGGFMVWRAERDRKSVV